MSGLVLKGGFPNGKRSFIQNYMLYFLLSYLLKMHVDCEETRISFIPMISCYQQTWSLVSSIKYPHITFFTQICNTCVCRAGIHLEEEYCMRNGF